MNNFIYIVISLFSVNNIYSQTPNDIQTSKFKFIVECPIYNSDIVGNITSNKITIAPEGADFIVVNVSSSDADDLVIRFTSLPSNYISDSSSISIPITQNDYVYYTIEKTDLMYKIKPIYKTSASFTSGIIIAPVKIRLSPYEFSKDFMIGTSIGAKWRLKESSNSNFINLLTSFGLSHVTLDGESTNYNIEGSSINQPAFSIGAGILFEINIVQFGIFVGVDYISQNDLFSWSRQGKPWISLGLSMSLIRQDGVGQRNDKRAKLINYLYN